MRKILIVGCGMIGLALLTLPEVSIVHVDDVASVHKELSVGPEVISVLDFDYRLISHAVLVDNHVAILKGDYSKTVGFLSTEILLDSRTKPRIRDDLVYT